MQKHSGTQHTHQTIVQQGKFRKSVLACALTATFALTLAAPTPVFAGPPKTQKQRQVIQKKSKHGKRVTKQTQTNTSNKKITQRKTTTRSTASVKTKSKKTTTNRTVRHQETRNTKTKINRSSGHASLNATRTTRNTTHVQTRQDTSNWNNNHVTYNRTTHRDIDVDINHRGKRHHTRDIDIDIDIDHRGRHQPNHHRHYDGCGHHHRHYYGCGHYGWSNHHHRRHHRCHHRHSHSYDCSWLSIDLDFGFGVSLGSRPYCPPRTVYRPTTVVYTSPVIYTTPVVYTSPTVVVVDPEPVYTSTYILDAGWDYLAEGEGYKALRIFQDQVLRNPNDPLARAGLAIARAMMHDDLLAAESMRAAFRIDSDDLKYMPMSESLDREILNLINQYESMKNLDPSDTDYRFMLASLSYLRHDERKAGYELACLLEYHNPGYAATHLSDLIWEAENPNVYE